MSEPSAGAGDVTASPAEQQTVEQQLQPEGQAVAQRPAGEARPPEEQAVESDPSSPAAGPEPGPGGPPPPTPTPKDPVQEQIERLESQYQGKRTAKDSADSEFADNEGRLKALRKLQADIDKVVQTYKAARDQLSIDQRDYDDYQDSEKKSLEAQLQPETVDKIKKATEDKKDRDNALAKARDESKSKLTTETAHQCPNALHQACSSRRSSGARKPSKGWRRARPPSSARPCVAPSFRGW